METRPLHVLNLARGKKIIVELRSGQQYIGVLRVFDINTNIVLESTEERVEGEIKRKLGTVFIHGNVIMLILFA